MLFAEQKELSVDQKHRLVSLYYKTLQPYESLRPFAINEELTDVEIHCADTIGDHFEIPFLDSIDFVKFIIALNFDGMKGIEKNEVCKIFIDMIEFMFSVRTVYPAIIYNDDQSDRFNAYSTVVRPENDSSETNNPTVSSLRDSVLKVKRAGLEPTVNAVVLLNILPKDVIIKLLSNGFNIPENFIKKILTLERFSADQAIQLVSVYNFTYDCKDYFDCPEPRSINQISIRDENIDSTIIFSNSSFLYKAFFD